MPLVLAMALSGIEREQWDSPLKDYFDIGAKFFNNVPPPFLQLSPAQSPNHSGSTTPTTSSGISTLSDETESNGSNEDEIHIPLLQIHNVDKVIVQKNKIVEETIEKLDEAKYVKPENIPSTSNDTDDILPYPVKETINFGGRNLLNLGSNAFSKDPFITFSQIKPGVQSFFENRSQISRLQGVYPPPYRKCKCPNCDLCESIFE